MAQPDEKMPNDHTLADLLAHVCTATDWLLHIEQERNTARIRDDAAWALAHQAERHRVAIDEAFRTWLAAHQWPR